MARKKNPFAGLLGPVGSAAQSGAVSPLVSAVQSGAGLSRTVAAGAGTAQSAPKVAAAAGQANDQVAQLVHLVPPSFAPYLPDVLAAAEKYNVPASVLLAQQNQESGFNPAAVSDKGAFGVSQFIPSTAQAYGVKPGTTPAAVRSQIEGQAHYMSDLVKQTGSLSGALSAYSGGYAAADYNNPILAAAKKYSIADSISGGVGGGPYVTPFQQAKYTQSRTDEGVDYSGSGLINAIGKARYLGQGQAWGPEAGGGGTGYGALYELLKGPKAGKDVFTYEGIAPAGPALSPGDIIHKGQPIASFAPGGSIETGWADQSGAPLAQPTYNEGDVTRPGTHFQKLLSTLGAASPPGSAPLSGGAVSPAAARQGALVSASTGASPMAAQSAVQSAHAQNQPTPAPLVGLTSPFPSNVPMPSALAQIFGGALPTVGGGGATPSSMSNLSLATLLAQLGQPTSPLSTLRKRRTYA